MLAFRGVNIEAATVGTVASDTGLAEIRLTLACDGRTLDQVRRKWTKLIEVVRVE